MRSARARGGEMVSNQLGFWVRVAIKQRAGKAAGLRLSPLVPSDILLRRSYDVSEEGEFDDRHSWALPVGFAR